MTEYVRIFSAAHASWIVAEIDKLVDAIPQQPAFSLDPLRRGDVIVSVRLVSPPATPASTFTDDIARGI